MQLSQDTLHLTLESAQEIAVAQSIDVQYTKMDAADSPLRG